MDYLCWGSHPDALVCDTLVHYICRGCHRQYKSCFQICILEAWQTLNLFGEKKKKDKYDKMKGSFISLNIRCSTIKGKRNGIVCDKRVIRISFFIITNSAYIHVYYWEHIKKYQSLGLSSVTTRFFSHS